MSTLLVFTAFWGLTLATVWVQGGAFVRARRREDWLIDGSGLLVQGALVPLAQLLLAYLLFEGLLPSWRGAVALPWGVAFAVNFVGVDYLYYWNHRLLHTARLWPLHAVHHSAERLDVLATSRNSLWTPLVIVYLWVNAFFAYVLADPSPFLLAAGLTAALDLWRHSGLGPAPGGALDRALGRLLVTPAAHAWHHSREDTAANFGANLTLWDRLHGTYVRPRAWPEALGVSLPGGARRRWLRPFAGARP